MNSFDLPPLLQINETVPLSGRNGILGDQRNSFFCDVAMGRGEQREWMFCITQSGILCRFNENRRMDKWVTLKVGSQHNSFEIE